MTISSNIPIFFKVGVKTPSQVKNLFIIVKNENRDFIYSFTMITYKERVNYLLRRFFNG
jgi:hypothetical protein